MISAPAQIKPLPVSEPEPSTASETATIGSLRDNEERCYRRAVAALWRSGAEAGSGGIYKSLLYVVGAYALLMTALAVYGLFFKSSEKLDPGHPLSTIPDNFGEYDPASRKRVGQSRLPLDGPLPANLKAGIGQKIVVGQLEIEPVGVEKRQLRIIKEGKAASDLQRRVTQHNALVLHLRVKNISGDIPIFPLDPAFTRAAKADDKPATRLLVGKQVLYGGAISWPFPDKVKREYEEAQARDSEPLKPGESRDYVVFTNEDSSLASAIRKMTDPLLWRVQIRRGSIEYKGKDVPVTAIIGVEFQPSEVKNLD